MGYCWPCTSLEGGLYFMSSAIIVIGLFMTGYLLYSLLTITAASSTSTGVAASSGFFIICFIYVILLLILGLIIFNGVEKKSTQQLKTSAIAFGILHGVIFLRVLYVLLSEVFLMLANGSGSKEKAESSSMFGFVFFTFLFFMTIIFLAFLTMHIRTLQAAQSSGHIFSQIQLGNEEGDGNNPLYAYTSNNGQQCHP